MRTQYAHHDCAIDFKFDKTMHGRILNFMNVIDKLSRFFLIIQVGGSCVALDVIDTIEKLLKLYPASTYLRIVMTLGSLPMPCRNGAQALIQ